MADEVERLKAELDEARDRADYWKGRAEAEWLEADKRGMERVREHVAERERDALLAELDEAMTERESPAIVDLREQLAVVEAERDALAARLAAAEKVVEAAKAWRDAWHATLADPTQTGVSLRVRGMELLAAVDAYRTHEPEPEQT